jgi:hypothetical protein
MTYQSLLNIVITITVLLFILTILISNKIFRYLFLTISLIFVLLAFSIYYSHNKRVKAIEKKMVGVYMINPVKSDLSRYDIDQIKNLTVTLNEDNTFKLSKEIPFIISNHGTWDYEDDGDIGITKLNLKDNNTIYIVVDDSILIMDNPLPKENYPQVKTLHWSRVYQ